MDLREDARVLARSTAGEVRFLRAIVLCVLYRRLLCGRSLRHMSMRTDLRFAQGNPIAGCPDPESGAGPLESYDEVAPV